MRRLTFRKLPLAAGLATALAIASYWVFPWLAPLPEGLRRDMPESRVVFDRNGTVLARLLHDRRFRHEQVALSQIPPALVAATVAAEDKRFYRHGGIDGLALCRSFWRNLRRLRPVSGASTITQQLVKISSAPAKRTVAVKLWEMLIARQVELRFSKERILEMYLNRLDYGATNLGCGAAAQFYFQKPLADLSVAECAMLAGIPQAPARLNPLRHPEAAKRRQLVVLGRCEKLRPGWHGELAIAAREPLRFAPIQEHRIAPHAVSLALRMNRGVTQLRTTIDAALQGEVEAILHNEVAALETRNVHNAAAVAIDNATGDILAFAGSSDFNSPQGGQIDGALWPRSPGSTLKAFTYLLAFESGAAPGDIVADVPARYPESGGFFTPENYDRVFHGPLSLREALANSVNAAAVRLLQQTGGAPRLLDTLHRLGFRNLTQPAGHYGLGLTIGNAEVRLLDLVNAYACIARLGEYRPWRLVIPTHDRSAAGARIFSPESCYLLADILSDNAARSPAFGSESPMRFPFRVGCKTGTSSDFRDNWCLAFTPEFTVGVWMGNHNGRPMQGVSGVSGAATAMHQIVTRLAARRAPTWYAKPPGVVAGAIDRRTGHAISAMYIANSPFRVQELFRADHPPQFARDEDYDQTGNALLADEVFAEWWRGSFNRFPAGYALRSSVQPECIEPRVLNPVSGSTYLLDPEMPEHGKMLALSSNLGDDAEWSSPTLTIGKAEGQAFAVLVSGTHAIVLRNPKSGVSATAQVRVEQR